MSRLDQMIRLKIITVVLALLFIGGCTTLGYKVFRDKWNNITP